MKVIVTTFPRCSINPLLRLLRSRSRCSFRNSPTTVLLNHLGDHAFLAVSAHHLNGNTPLCSGLFYWNGHLWCCAAQRRDPYDAGSALYLCHLQRRRPAPLCRHGVRTLTAKKAERRLRFFCRKRKINCGWQKRYGWGRISTENKKVLIIVRKKAFDLPVEEAGGEKQKKKPL